MKNIFNEDYGTIHKRKIIISTEEMYVISPRLFSYNKTVISGSNTPGDVYK